MKIRNNAEQYSYRENTSETHLVSFPITTVYSLFPFFKKVYFSVNHTIVLKKYYKKKLTWD